MVEVKLFANFREVLDEGKIIVSAETVHELIDNICVEHEGFEEEIFSDSEELRDYVNIVVDGVEISELDGLGTELEKDDKVAIFPPVSGG